MSSASVDALEGQLSNVLAFDRSRLQKLSMVRVRSVDSLCSMINPRGGGMEAPETPPIGMCTPTSTACADVSPVSSAAKRHNSSGLQAGGHHHKDCLQGGRAGQGGLSLRRMTASFPDLPALQTMTAGPRPVKVHMGATNCSPLGTSDGSICQDGPISCSSTISQQWPDSSSTPDTPSIYPVASDGDGFFVDFWRPSSCKVSGWKRTTPVLEEGEAELEDLEHDSRGRQKRPREQ